MAGVASAGSLAPDDVVAATGASGDDEQVVASGDGVGSSGDDAGSSVDDVGSSGDDEHVVSSGEDVDPQEDAEAVVSGEDSFGGVRTLPGIILDSSSRGRPESSRMMPRSPESDMMLDEDCVKGAY